MKNYFKIEWKEFLSSFKLKTDFALVFLIDVAFIALSYLIMLLFGSLTTNLAVKMNAVDLANIMNATGPEIQAQTAMLKGFLFSLAGYFIVMIILLFLLFGCNATLCAAETPLRLAKELMPKGPAALSGMSASFWN